MEIKPSNIYCYYVKNHHAIKVGFGDSSSNRMRDYAKIYRLDVDVTSLKSWDVPISGLAQAIEAACHEALIESGMNRHTITSPDGQEAQELFFLGSTSYNDAVLVVAGAIDETIDVIASKFSKSNRKGTESSRQKYEENRIKREELKRRKEEEYKSLVSDCSFYIRKVWQTKFQPYADLLQKARTINVNFEYRESTLKRLFNGEQDPVLRMLKWPQYSQIRNIIIQAFEPQRSAKKELIDIYKKFKNGNAIITACENTKLHIWRPGDFELPMVENSIYGSDWAFVEVRLMVQSATYCFGGEDAEKLIRLDPPLQSLVKRASESPPPERLDTEWCRY